MPERNAYFTGRVSYLSEMHKSLCDQGLVYLTGYGGIGKTQIAKEYSYVYEKNYDLIWWFDLKNNLIMQYESLLVHLSNRGKFKELLHVNINDIAPDVVVDFINSLLSTSKIKWLLIFDNVSEDKIIKYPKPTIAGQHIIITTREKLSFGKNVLAIEPFTDQEAEAFLFRIFPKEERSNIKRLYKTLHNYPLALSQSSEEILMYEEGAGSYLSKYRDLKQTAISVQSNVIQSYNQAYRKVLSLTLDKIEKKEPEAAKILYMLALIDVNLTSELLENIFDFNIQGKLVILSKYGVIQTIRHGNDQIITLHDVIKEEAIRRVNHKGKKDKREIITTMAKYFASFYSDRNFEYLNTLDSSSNCLLALYKFIDIALQNNIINNEVINSIIVALKLNNMLFNKYTDYSLYQQIANKVYNKNLDHIAPERKALLFASLIFSDFIISSEKHVEVFEKETLRLLSQIEQKQNEADLFFIYTHMAQFYLFLGNFPSAKKYIGIARQYLNSVANYFSLLQYWYTNLWLSYELRDTDAGLRAVTNFLKLNKQHSTGKLGELYVMNLKIKFHILLGQMTEAKNELAKALKDIKIYYNNAPSDVLGELEYTQAMVYFYEGQYSLALMQCKRALNILNKVFGGEMIDLTQANIHLLLGMMAEKKENYTFALGEYAKAINFYNKLPHWRKSTSYEYGELLANLSFIYYKQKDFYKFRLYYRQLISIFNLEHEIVEKLIKRLPHDWVLQVPS